MDDREISLSEIFVLIKKSLVWIILISIFCGGIAFGISEYLITPVYEAETTMMISGYIGYSGNNNVNSDTQMSDLRLNKELAATYSEIIKTRGIFEIVNKNLGLNMSYDDFMNNVSVVSKNDTEIMVLSVKDTNQTRAMDMANEIVMVFKEFIIETSEEDKVQILDKAIEPEKPISPKILQNTVMGVLLGGVLSTFIFLAIGLFDTTIKSEEDFENTFDIPVIGIIPDKKK